MKRLTKLKIVLVVCSFVISMNSFSQEEKEVQEVREVIKTNPIGLAFGNFNATYETLLNTKSSILFSASYMYKFLGIDISAGSWSWLSLLFALCKAWYPQVLDYARRYFLLKCEKLQQ